MPQSIQLHKKVTTIPALRALKSKEVGLPGRSGSERGGERQCRAWP
jgi:hypothetical protein